MMQVLEEPESMGTCIKLFLNLNIVISDEKNLLSILAYRKQVFASTLLFELQKVQFEQSATQIPPGQWWIQRSFH